MGYIGHDGRDGAFLRDGRTDEDGRIGIACKVGGTTNTVHHLGAQDMGRIDIAIDIHFQRSVDGDDTKSAYNLRVIRQLIRSQDDVILVEVDVIHHLIIICITQVE